MPRKQLSAMGNDNGNGDGQWQWRLQLPMVTKTAMANGKGDEDGNGWCQCKRDGGSDGGWWLGQQWLMATAIGYSNVDIKSNGDRDGNGDGDSNRNSNGHNDGNNDERRAASSCAGNVQRCGRGNTLPPPPWTQRKVHSPMLHHGGNTAKSVCSLSRGRVPDSHHWLFICLFFTNTVQFTGQSSVCPCIIQALKKLVSPLMLYLLHSSKNPINILTMYPGSYCTFCQDKPRQGLQWLQPFFFVLMWNGKSLSNLLYFPNFSFVIDRTHQIHLKTPCCDSWDIQGQSLSCSFKALSCPTLLPSLGACICLATF